MSRIDLNADIGEGAPCDDELLRIVSSANIACGGHAGDAETMARTIRAAIANGVAVGAHPAYPDREGFGRVSGFMRGDALYESLTQQVAALTDI
ncbi:MAG: LamB/YcsF family protein, partial [Proteobacteria bacterium]|nr:LamB/YcsF family protein [Pseudomonadota bacterium]